MDAFEQLASELFFRAGYWTQNSLKVELTKAEKVAIGRPSSPRWELDLVAYSGGKNELLALECKSFLDSTGVTYAELQPGHPSTKYKLFREDGTRAAILDRMKADLVSNGYVPPDCKVGFGLVAGKIKRGDDEALADYFSKRGWHLFGPQWLKQKLTSLASSGYSNDVSAVVTKILLR